MYHLPRRHTALARRQMDFWDAVYYLAHLGGGRAVVSSRELGALTGLDRRKIAPLLKTALEQGALRQDTPLDPPGPWHFELIVPNYHTETDVILKPLGYVANGWLRLVQPALPKRLLNHLLHQVQAQGNPIAYDSLAAATALRRTDALTPVFRERIQSALDALVRLGLVKSLSDQRLQLDFSRFDIPAPLETSPEEASDRYRRIHAVDPLCARRALALIRSGNLPFEQDFERIFLWLADPAHAADLARLRESLRNARHRPPEQRWEWTLQRLQRQKFVTQAQSPTTETPVADLWPALRQHAWRHTRPALENLKREKYRPDVYAPRPTADAAFARFQLGHRPALALVGPAGVGKSSTLARWAEQTLDQGQAVLFYLAPALDLASQDLLNRITRDLGLTGKPSPFAIRHSPFAYVFVDALNEAPDPLSLTAALNAALQNIAADPSRPPWRFVLSCRQETWERLTRRGLPYPALLHGGGPVSLGPFDEHELGDAFERYQTHYGLRNGLAQLSPALRRLLRVPLLLGLAADAYRDHPLPARGLSGEVIDRYLAQKLPDPTHTLLLRRIIVLMREAHNLALSLARLWADSVAAPLVARTDPDAPYPHLRSEGIIAESVSPSGNIEIRLTYERVFEHMLGQVALPDTLNRDALLSILAEGLEFPSLRNAVVNRLVAHPGLSLLERLAADPDPGLRGLARDTLVIRHERGDAQVDDCLDRLTRCPDANAVHSGLAVALERHSLPPIIKATAHSKQLAREQGILYAYYLWRRDHARGWLLLQDLSRRAVGRFGLLHRQPLTALLQISILIFTSHLSPETVAELQPLLNLWRDLLRRIPLLGGRSTLAARARSILITVGDHTLDAMIKAIPLHKATPTSSGQAHTLFSTFYTLPPQEKQFLSERLDALDPERASIEDPATAQALLDLFRKRSVNMMFFNLPADALAGHHEHQPEATKALLRCMLSSTDEEAVAYAVHATKPIAAQSQFDTTRELAISLNDRLEQWESERTGTRDACFMFSRTMLSELRTGRLDPTLIDRLLEPAWARNDPAAVVIILYSLEELAYLGHPLPALRALCPHFDDQRPTVRAALIEILRRLVVLYPDDVHFFLEQAPLDLSQSPHSGQPSAILWQLIGRRVQQAWEPLFIVPPIRRFFLDILRQTLLCPDWPAARRLIIERLIEALIE